jgi:hypothetical protein
MWFRLLLCCRVLLCNNLRLWDTMLLVTQHLTLFLNNVRYIHCKIFVYTYFCCTKKVLHKIWETKIYGIACAALGLETKRGSARHVMVVYLDFDLEAVALGFIAY